MQSVERIVYAIFYRFNEQRVRALLSTRAIRVRALLSARAIRVRALLGARAIIVAPHPPPFYTSSLTPPWVPHPSFLRVRFFSKPVRTVTSTKVHSRNAAAVDRDVKIEHAR